MHTPSFRTKTRPSCSVRSRGTALLILRLLLGSAVPACQDLGDAADAGAFDGGASDAASSAPGCGLSNEPEPNDSAAQATSYVIGSAAQGCLASASDVDVFEVKAPTTGTAGGYFQGSLTEVGAGTLAVEITSARDNAPFLRGTFTNTPGASLFFYWAAAPGGTYRVAVSRFSAAAAPFRFTFRSAYTAVNDTFEPNDTREEAKPVALGNAISAFFFAGHVSEVVEPAAFSDWYSVVLAAGTASFRLTNVPTSVRPEIEVYDANNNRVRALSMYSNTPGGNLDITGPVAAGPHRLVVRIFALAPETAGKGD
ncbi:MAG TPA: hypothetical protein VGF45_17015, partial [Polyangia bacterium]